MVPKVLIGEDEAIVAMDIEITLTEMGYLVVGIGSSGESIIEMNKKLKPDIILMDIRLKGLIDGFQAAAQIQNEYDVPILFVTAGSEVSTPQKFSKSTRHSFLHKPFSYNQLEEAVKSLLRKKKARNKSN